METVMKYVTKEFANVFKSYYVVWKRAAFGRRIKKIVRLNRTMQYGNDFAGRKRKTFRLFKSYYVVWKPMTLIVNFGILFCLNRTMQYGNSRGLSTDVKNRQSLNRTMQYGNGEAMADARARKKV